MQTTTTTRIRRIAPVVATRADAERVLGELAADTAEKARLSAELEAEIVAVRQRYEGDIDSLGKKIEAATGLLQSWAEGAPEEFAAKKSVEFLHGRLGFRTGNPKLQTISGWTFKKVLEVIWPEYIRVKKDLDKEAIIAAYARAEIDDKGLRSAGLRIVQDEAFFIEPKAETPAA